MTSIEVLKELKEVMAYQNFAQLYQRMLYDISEIEDSNPKLGKYMEQVALCKSLVRQEQKRDITDPYNKKKQEVI